MKCRHCQTQLEFVFLDLGMAPPSNNYLTAEDLARPEKFFPLRLFACDACWLVQTEDYSDASDLFRHDYAYFSSTSSGWLAHAAEYSRKIISQLALDDKSFVIEVASNDGYLLKNFVAAGIPCLGIEPTESTAQAAEALNIPVLKKFFGEELARQIVQDGKSADLIIGNNVFAHVPDINDFTFGMKTALKPGGTITLEFPHLMEMIVHKQFDTVYHEHFSYLSLFTTEKIFERAGLRVFDVEKLPTHGGSLRIYGCHQDDPRARSESVDRVLKEEEAQGMRHLDRYRGFQQSADKIKNDFHRFLAEKKKSGKTVAGYGAAAKGNTLLNYAGITPDLLPFICDAAPSKQGKYAPGSHIPIKPPAALEQQKPDFVVILPWNIAPEVIRQQAVVKTWGGKFLTAIPEIKIMEPA